MQLRLKNAEREIEDVHGGRIVRPIGRKDRHSKVCTPKGLRDRRVRLSAHAAIQFYDVQDQLGFDRPSKVIDWLMEKAKKAIDELEKVPNNGAQQTEQEPEEQNPDDHLQHQQQYNDLQDLNENPINNLSFFSPSSSINLLNHPPDLNSRAVGRTQDLFLNLHNSSSKNVGEIVFDPTFNDWSRLETPEMNQLQIISETGNGGEGFGFNSALEMGQFQKMIAWNSESGNGEEEFCFNYLPLCQNQLLSQREPLQSSNSPSSNYALNKLPISTNAHHQNPAFNPCVGFTSNGFSRFRIPAQIHGEDEMQNAVSNKPS